DLATTVEVDADGQYVFSIVSDGGSRLLIDGAVVIDDAATHPLGPVPSDPTFLTLGTHALEIQLVECCNGTPGVDLVRPEGITMAELTAVPEPASVALLGLGLLCVAIICRRRVAAPAKSYRPSFRHSPIVSGVAVQPPGERTLGGVRRPDPTSLT